VRAAATFAVAMLAGGLAGSAAAQTLPTVASTNLCADQLVLTLADPGQVLSVSWLAADPEESVLAEAAAGVPLNYATAEELLRLAPDVVIAGVYTAAYTGGMLRRLGYRVVELQPAETLVEVEASVRLVAQVVGQPARGEAVIEVMRRRAAAIAARRRAPGVEAVVVRPGGFTVGADSLTHELMRLAGLRNVAAERGLDRWGSLSMETLVTAEPALIVLIGYRSEQPSLANAVLRHPALDALSRRAMTARVPAALVSCGLPQSLAAAELMQAAAQREP
jgi:iron complex transport system substrate-binding protein